MKILVVDDDNGTLNAIKVNLISQGHEVLIAKEGKSALKIIEKTQRDFEPPDLLLTDFKMPGMDGLKLIQLAREIDPNIRGILMTAYGDDNIRQEVESLKSCNYIDKPFSPETLIHLIEKKSCIEKDI